MINKKDNVDSLYKDLNSSDIKKRIKAVNRMVEMKEKGVEKNLIKLLYDESWHLRNYVAKVLSGFGKDIIPPLLEETKEGIWYVRDAVCKTLGYIADIDCLDPLVSFLEDSSERVKLTAEKALMLIINKDRVTFVESYLSKKDADFQELIMEKLRKIDTGLYKDIVDENSYN